MADSIVNKDVGEMTHRERFRRVMHYQSVDRIPHWEFGYLGETIERWHGEGLPEEYDDNPSVEAYFGVDPRAGVPFRQGLIPPFEGEWEVLEEGEEKRVVRQPDGSVLEEKTRGVKTIPHYIKFPIEGWEDWERFKERLDPEDPRRFETDYEALGRELLRSELPVGTGLGSYFGIPRNWIGFENISLMLYDDRELVEDIVETLTRVYYRQIEEALKHVEVDFAGGWEDICFRSGPMISPGMFREVVGPRLKRVCDLLRRHGCTVIWTDCDGDVTDLVPVWLECGLNCMFPLEVHPGSDPVKYRKMFGRELLLRGGLNKHRLADGPQAILDELKRVEWVVEDGGFIPHGDHRIPETVSLENYRYYIREKLAMLGWSAEEVAQVPGLQEG
ncbi:MAG: uroporphyrinogen decarboxylase family protein [Candidatus Brocadiaceae bacterium]|jgi:uroporphyrinogen decarboxylase